MVVNNLFEENRAKIGNTQAQINVAKQKVVRLPDSEQKTALLEKVAQTQQAYDTLMKIWEVANSTIENYFINGEIGNPKGALTTEEMVDLSQKLNDLPYRDIKILEGYTTNELWAKYDQLITVSSAIPSVEELFTNDKPSPNNTQDQINISLHLVNQLVDGPCKQKLLAKVQEAQQAYDATHSGTKNSTEK
ncbi:MAG: hypothetical protein IC227_10115 [Enterococcus lacertideformus]|uniref:Pesticidal crystal protein Cry1Aa domain-containing protein n=1 Tax=Enterococcus lacertideformus TaxID=2771493 RepID=A0A931FD74_9ENTE|nr:hypothetical protein [Enterococcus lacertideformus]